MSALPSRDPVTAKAVLRVEGLRVELRDGSDVVSDIHFSVAAGEVVGLVGESGSGKTTIASALLAHARAGARIVGGSVWIDGTDLLALPAAELARWRGRRVSYVPQDPAMALSPVLRIGTQLHETLVVHEPALVRAARADRIAQTLRDVGLPSDDAFLRRFPHELSGGQQQRVLLALAFMLRPTLIVLDEPTTALDVTTQAKILETISALCRSHGVAAVYVSHDLAVVRHLADRVIVLYAGRIVEAASRDALFDAPAHPYSEGLLGAIPDVALRTSLRPIPGLAPAPQARPQGCAFAPRCRQRSTTCTERAPALSPSGDGQQVACWHPLTRRGAGRAVAAAVPTPVRDAVPALLEVDGIDAAYGPRQVLFGVSFSLQAGECLALVGESGSGKTTLARALAGLGDHAQGQVRYEGQDLPLNARERDAALRRQIQYVFQNPYRALNPRKTVGRIIGDAVHHFFDVDRAEGLRRAVLALQRVALPPETLALYPGDLSGGERQRVAIARALICEPRVLICDEVTSALDVSVQATVLELLGQLQREGLAILFVTHNLGVVRAVADRIVVLREGRIVEAGAADAVLDRPANLYTRTLVHDSPSLLRASRAPPQPLRAAS
ncbi:peptide/nickel transport system ATP-binding protein [Panacagrimonas perspica]|uniref:Peptide/nickel transport system ATP-binding protein n=1 Tax=Panacagrimonas perspica TaxID=381431 RepID=A0A4S3K4R0_9GAMM|nr:ABC transporter ATP-binding protein [Panacagrimonas perspica]TDU31712.1 peptide/nickel transport system ATP-binding protein [Panacagrimonas perspica]THD03073.1 peptide ABC transporter ATP-binding protein [Panacagrimonas perspica]